MASLHLILPNSPDESLFARDPKWVVSEEPPHPQGEIRKMLNSDPADGFHLVARGDEDFTRGLIRVAETLKRLSEVDAPAGAAATAAAAGAKANVLILAFSGPETKLDQPRSPAVRLINALLAPGASDAARGLSTRAQFQREAYNSIYFQHFLIEPTEAPEPKAAASAIKAVRKSINDDPLLGRVFAANILMERQADSGANAGAKIEAMASVISGDIEKFRNWAEAGLVSNRTERGAVLEFFSQAEEAVPILHRVGKVVERLRQESPATATVVLSALLEEMRALRRDWEAILTVDSMSGGEEVLTMAAKDIPRVFVGLMERYLGLAGKITELAQKGELQRDINEKITEIDQVLTDLAAADGVASQATANILGLATKAQVFYQSLASQTRWQIADLLKAMGRMEARPALVELSERKQELVVLKDSFSQLTDVLFVLPTSTKNQLLRRESGGGLVAAVQRALAERRIFLHEGRIYHNGQELRLQSLHLFLDEALDEASDEEAASELSGGRPETRIIDFTAPGEAAAPSEAAGRTLGNFINEGVVVRAAKPPKWGARSQKLTLFLEDGQFMELAAQPSQIPNHFWVRNGDSYLVFSSDMKTLRIFSVREIEAIKESLDRALSDLAVQAIAYLKMAGLWTGLVVTYPASRMMDVMSWVVERYRIQEGGRPSLEAAANREVRRRIESADPDSHWLVQGLRTVAQGGLLLGAKALDEAAELVEDLGVPGPDGRVSLTEKNLELYYRWISRQQVVLSSSRGTLKVEKIYLPVIKDIVVEDPGVP